MAPPSVGVASADEDRAEHEEDQQQRRHHDEGDLLGHARHQPQAGEALDRADDEGVDRAGGDHLDEQAANASWPLRRAASS